MRSCNLPFVAVVLGHTIENVCQGSPCSFIKFICDEHSISYIVQISQVLEIFAERFHLRRMSVRDGLPSKELGMS